MELFGGRGHNLQMSKLRAFVVAWAAVTTPAFAQTPAPAPKPTFEVASVKPNNGDARGSSWAIHPGGRFTAMNLPLHVIIRNAFALQPSQLVGLPDWASSERFDIAAKAEQDFPRTTEKPSLAQLMVQSLLEERFNLVAHREKRDIPVYALVLARADGRLGPQLKESDVDCAALAAAQKAGGSVSGGGAVSAPGPSSRPAPGERRPCTMTSNDAMLRGTAIPMAALVATLSSAAERIVVDRTGLKGSFDFDLTFSRAQSPDTSAPSVFTAVQEQLGLKLESVRMPMEVLVIDSIDRPTPD
jgi:uncharacterized protein (TIGR03435 family)